MTTLEEYAKSICELLKSHPEAAKRIASRARIQRTPENNFD